MENMDLSLLLILVLCLVGFVEILLLILLLTRKQSDGSEVVRGEISRLRSEINNVFGQFSRTFNLQQDSIRQSVEKMLSDIQRDNSEKLERMRQTVDEKLHKTLETRLGESFRLVNNHLSAVQKGLGEMQSLASDVGDLKKVLTNVKTKGNIGEYQLEGILEQILTPNQFVKNYSPRSDSREVVEFAIKLPSKSKNGDFIYLPLDSKFPTVDYERLLNAYDVGNQKDIEACTKNLVGKIKTFAKDIQSKYIFPPTTTDFGIMFLPIEGLYAEVLRIPGLFETIQREYHVTITGPTTVSAFLSSLQMGFRTLQIEQHTDEVWRLLETVKREFSKFGDILEKTREKLEAATKEISNAESKSRTIERKLRDTDGLLPQ